MRNGPKLRQLLSLCDIYLSMDEDGNMILTTTSKTEFTSRRKEGKTFSVVLDKAYRQALKDASTGFGDDDE